MEIVKQKSIYCVIKNTPLSTLYNSLILKGLKFNSFLAKNCKPSIYRALEKRVESQVKNIKNYSAHDKKTKKSVKAMA